jgi:hypothetical protein
MPEKGTICPFNNYYMPILTYGAENLDMDEHILLD